MAVENKRKCGVRIGAVVDGEFSVTESLDVCECNPLGKNGWAFRVMRDGSGEEHEVPFHSGHEPVNHRGQHEEDIRNGPNVRPIEHCVINDSKENMSEEPGASNRRGGTIIADSGLEPHCTFQNLLAVARASYPLLWDFLDIQAERVYPGVPRFLYKSVLVPLIMLSVGVVAESTVPALLFLNKFLHDLRTGLLLVRAATD
jgi:hypothetical protein